MRLLRAPFLAFVLTTILLSLFYGPEFNAPNDHYFGAAEDGFKNYYTVAYHQQYDTAFTHFGGMSYPFGEHIVFTDGQPLISALLWVLPGDGSYTVGILNLIMLLSISLCAWILCKLFLLFELRRGRALFASSAIALLSPQILRLEMGHYALGIVCILPWVMYTAILFMRKPDWKRSLWVFLAMNVATWLHLYYLVMAAGFILIYYLVEYLRKRPLPFWKLGLHGAIQVILPFLGFALWLGLTDTIPDRPAAPHGMLAYMARWEGVFLPYYLFKDSNLFQSLDVRKLELESLAYVGIPAGLYFIYFGLSRVKLFGKAHKPRLSEEHSLLLAGFGVFIFAATLPFAMENEWFARMAGPLKQFRSMGRFSWVFFYALNIFVFIQLAKRYRGLSKYLFTAACLILFYEGLYFHDTFQQRIGQERVPVLSAAERVNLPAQSPIFPYPYFHIGSENLGSRSGGIHMADPTMQLSLETGLPTFGTMASRVSLEQTLQQMELAYNLSGPLMLLDDEWVILADRQYQHWTGPALFPNAFLIRKKPGSILVTQKRQQILRNKHAQFLRADTTFSRKSTIGLALDPAEKGLGRDHYLLPLDKRSRLLSLTNNDERELTFWIKVDRDGFRSYRASITCDGKTTVIPFDQLYDNAFRSFVRITIPIPKGDQVSLDFYTQNPVEGAETIISLPILHEKDQDYWLKSGGLVFTSEFVYETDLD